MKDYRQNKEIEELQAKQTSIGFFFLNLVVLFLFSEFIESLPLANTPEVFGLHPNAEIGYYTNAAKEMWSHLVELQPQTSKD